MNNKPGTYQDCVHDQSLCYPSTMKSSSELITSIQRGARSFQQRHASQCLEPGLSHLLVLQHLGLATNQAKGLWASRVRVKGGSAESGGGGVSQRRGQSTAVSMEILRKINADTTGRKGSSRIPCPCNLSISAFQKALLPLSCLLQNMELPSQASLKRRTHCGEMDAESGLSKF